MLNENPTVLAGIVALEKRTALPSNVKKRPGTLLPVPLAARAAASAGVIVPNCARPSASGAATGGTLRS